MNLNIHDWTLSETQVQWDTGKCVVEFRGPDGKSKFVNVIGFSHVLIPKLEEWGPSSSVNRCSINREGDSSRMIIEMQSGDELAFIGKEIEIKDY